MTKSDTQTLLFGELQDLKRQQPAHLDWSITTDLFRRAWTEVLVGRDPTAVAWRIAARALTNILFPGCDERFFGPAGLSAGRTTELLRDALYRSGGRTLSEDQLLRLTLATGELAKAYHGPRLATSDKLPEPLELLCRQPRAGATRPGFPRLLLVPPELHSDHCLMTAVYAVLYAEHYRAEVGTVFLCALAHHLHNAILPDCGFAGEICLGEDLDRVIANCRREALAAFPKAYRETIAGALRHHETIATAEGKAVSAGDVLDRVLDVKWRTRAAAVTDADILGDLDLVHAGPLKSFQTELLASLNLWN